MAVPGGASDTIYVTNISPMIEETTLRDLFKHMGTVKDMNVSVSGASKYAFLLFETAEQASAAVLLNDTMLADRPLKITLSSTPFAAIPKAEAVAVAPAVAAPAAPSPMDGPTGNVDPNKRDEIARTIFVGNLNTAAVTTDVLIQYFQTCGPINFCKMAGDPMSTTRYAFVEFLDRESALKACTLNGQVLGGRPVKVHGAKNAIVKPQATEDDNKKKDAAMQKVKELQERLLGLSKKRAADKAAPVEEKEKSSSSRRRSRSRERVGRKDRDRGGDRRRSRSRDRGSRRRDRGDRDRGR